MERGGSAGDAPAAERAEAVREQYENYSYPGTTPEILPMPELGILLKYFLLENDLRQLRPRLLDVGTGTGDRLIGAAEILADFEMTGIDFSRNSIDLARQSARRHKERARSQVEFRVGDILAQETLEGLGVDWPLITCMGVIHHVPDSERALAGLRSLLAEQGLLILYVYGDLGSRDRHLQRDLIRRLQDDPEDLADGIAVANALDIEIDDYGWRVTDVVEKDAEDEARRRAREASIVDALLNRYEMPYTLGSLLEELDAAGFAWVSLMAVAVGRKGLQVETGWKPDDRRKSITVVKEIAGSPFLLERYQRLSTLEKLQLIELAFKPSGYTVVVGRTAASVAALGRRLRGNLVTLEDA